LRKLVRGKFTTPGIRELGRRRRCKAREEGGRKEKEA